MTCAACREPDCAHSDLEYAGVTPGIEPAPPLVVDNDGLAHCPECNVWLAPHESCLHIAPQVALRDALHRHDTGAPGADQPFHDRTNTPGGQHDHVGRY